MAIKRVEFLYAPSGAVDNHQRYELGVGLDPLPVVATPQPSTPPIVPSFQTTTTRGLGAVQGLISRINNPRRR